MKQRFLHYAFTAALSFTGVCSYAQSDWAIPVDPMESGCLEIEDGAEVVFYNVEAGLFMTGGNKVSAPWATQTSLTSTNPLTFKLKYNEEDETWTIITASGTHSGKNVIAPNAGGDQPYLYIDASGDPAQGCVTWVVDGTAEDGYTFDLTQEDLAADGTFLGTPSEGNINVVCNANPDDGAQIYWKFITPADAATIGPKIAAYKVRCELFELASEAPKSVDMTAISAVYNNADATAEELQAALGQLKAAILEAELKEEAGEASPENPIDITEQVINNPSFDIDVTGWTNTGGMGHSPVGASYSNEDSQISDFCEKWTWAKSLDGSYGISQTFNLPAGLYRLEMDAIATCQQDQSITVSGVKFYVKNENTYEVAVATANNAPKHYAIDFVNDGTTAVTIGFGCEATDANWMAVDNFVLYNCGKSTKSAAYHKLQTALNTAAYPEDELEDLEADKNLKVSYSDAFAAAQKVLDDAASTDEQFADAQAKFEAAQATLGVSVADYSALRSIEQNFTGISGALLDIDEDGTMESTVADIAVAISDLCEEGTCDSAAERAKYSALNKAYNDLLNLFTYTAEKKEANAEKEACVAAIDKYEGDMRKMWVEGAQTLTSEQVAKLKEEIADAVGKFNRLELATGDVTDDVLVNPSFEENVDGWDNVGGMGHDPNGTVYTNDDVTVASFCEKWTPGPNKLGNEYRISQTVYMPAGLYRLEADAIATQQSDGSVTVEGVKLYVKNGKTYEVAVATANEKPQHYVIEFFNDDTKGTEIGFGCDANTTANWIAVDNFQLTYIGNSAKDFAERIEYLIMEIDDMVSEGYPTADLDGKIKQAKADADAAIQKNDAQACLDAIDMLKAVTNEIAPVLAETKKLGQTYEYYMSVLDDVNTTGKGAFETYMAGIMDKLTNAGIANVAAVAPLAEEMAVKFTECVQSDAKGATEENPYDMTAAIVNPEYYCEYAMEAGLYDSEYNAFGWEGDAPSVNENAAEYWRSTWTAGVDCHQTIKGLAPGYYKLHVNGYNRQGQGYDHEIYKDSWATLYAGNYSTRLLDVLAGKQDYPVAGYDEHEIVEEINEDIDEETEEETTISYYYPTMMGSTRVYFDEGFYKNTLIFKVEEGQTEITIGVKKTVYTDSWDSLAFDDWSLEYVGTTEPTEVSTAIESVARENVAGTKIYSVNGVQMNKLAKGINIIKTVDESGRISVRKVLVK